VTVAQVDGAVDEATVAVVIVTYNSAEVLGGCLDSLAGQGVELAGVVVADNASADESVAIARAAAQGLPVRTVQLGHNAGYAAAINAGIAATDLAKLDAVFVMNPDCRLRPGALGRLAAALREPGRGIALPLMLNPDGSLQPSLRRAPTVARAWAEAILGGTLADRFGGLGELVMDPAAYEKSGPAVWGTGAAMLLSAEMVRQIGMWDESFLLYSEETEYSLRAADHGWISWYEPSAVVEHINRVSATNPLLAALLAVNKTILFRRRHGRVASWAYHGAVLMSEAIRAAAGRHTSRAAAAALLRPSRRDEVIRIITTKGAGR
jgi:N-acetylglucosaminyl-diphospho-decaprenol L-rhamnosyltransferase